MTGKLHHLSGNDVRPLSETVHGIVTEDNYTGMLATVRLAIAQGSACAVDLSALSPNRAIEFTTAANATPQHIARKSARIAASLSSSPSLAAIARKTTKEIL